MAFIASAGGGGTATVVRPTWAEVLLYVVLPVLVVLEIVGYIGLDGPPVPVPHWGRRSQPAWQTYDSATGRFSVELRGRPETTTDDRGETTCAGTSHRSTCVMWADFGTELEGDQARTTLQAYVQGTAEDGGRVVRTADIEYLGRPAVDFVVAYGKDYLRGRMVIAGRLGYVVGVMSDVEEPAEFPRFVNSFALR